MRNTERLRFCRCPCCFKNEVSHNWFTTEDSRGDGTVIRHEVSCRNCGRSTLPMDTELEAIHAFTHSLETCWYANASTVLVSLDTLNALIKDGKQIDKAQLDKIDLRRRLG